MKPQPSLSQLSEEIRLTAIDPCIASLSDIHHLRADTDTGDPALQAPTAEARHLQVRMKIAIAWGRENLDTDMQPKAGSTGYRIDTFIRSLVDRHHLSAHSGESDLSLTLRALGTEFGQIADRAKAIARATEKAVADQNPHHGSQGRP